eukprot:6352735-Pyramimonas_sp.AAC.1
MFARQHATARAVSSFKPKVNNNIVAGRMDAAFVPPSRGRLAKCGEVGDFRVCGSAEIGRRKIGAIRGLASLRGRALKF